MHQHSCSVVKNSQDLQHELFIFDANLVSHLPRKGFSKVVHGLVRDLLTGLNMKKLGPLEIYEASDLRFPGFSFIQPITTSHISGHYFEKIESSSHIHMDIYSCKPFAWKKIITMLDASLRLADWKANTICRSLDGHRSCSEIIGRGKKIVKVILLNPKK